jgi:hypothetical protein
MPTVRYSPVERCIYCGETQSKLGDEHIIAFALAGNLILPKASCKACEKITQRYELTVARQMFGNFRMRHHIQTRNPNQRPTHIKIGTVNPDGTPGQADVPVSQYPAPLFVYKFAEANMLLGLPPEVDDFQWVPISIFSKDELDAMHKKYQWDLKTSFKTVPVEFARMLAKIAHSYAVAELGIDAFHHNPMTLDVICNRTKNVSYTVGGRWEVPPAVPGAGHLLSTVYQRTVPRVLIVVQIRLFASLEMPIYHVVVGNVDFQNARHVSALSEKLRNAQTVVPIPR